VSKAAAGRLAPREALQLGRGLGSIEAIKCLLEGVDPENGEISNSAEALPEALHSFIEQLDCCSELRELIGRSILPEAAVAVGKGDVVAGRRFC